nr:unnamed protein product [Digitaria exilis]
MALPPAPGAPAMNFASKPRGLGLRRPSPEPPGAALRLGPLFWPWEKFSLLSMGDEQMELKTVCDSLGIRLIAYSPLGLGMLTGKSVLFRQILPGLESLLSSLRRIAEKKGKTMSQVAINWCICKGTIPIPGVKSIRHVEENLGALGWRLSPAEISELESAAMAAPKKMIQNVFQTA